MADVQLIVNGAIFEGWLSMRLERSLESAAAAFSLSFSERWSAYGKRIPIDEGDACTVKVRGQLALTGYVDVSDVSYSRVDHSMSITGRSKAGDIVDSSAVHPAGQWKDQSILQIARDLCQPYGVSVSSDIDLSKTLNFFSLQQGETVFEALERGARMYGCLLTSGPDGALTFTQAGRQKTKTVLKTGVNIESGHRRGSMKDRFKTYIVKAQARGTDDAAGETVATPKSTSTDAAVKRNRTLIILAEEQCIGDLLDKRALWERNVRAGRARRVSYTVRGWEHSEGLWAPNLRVQVTDPVLRIDAELLVVSAVLILDDEGARTELELTNVEAFTVLELPPKNSLVIGGGS